MNETDVATKEALQRLSDLISDYANLIRRDCGAATANLIKARASTDIQAIAHKLNMRTTQ